MALALDAGQTEIKARIIMAGRPPVELSLPGVFTDRDLLPQLAAVTRQVSREFDTAIDIVSAGVSGLTSASADAFGLLNAVAGVGVGRALLAHDSVTSFLGALGDRTGAVVAAGTGSVTLAVGPTHVTRVDGWGNIMGDAGSGYWIGRAALEAVMRAHDGRGRPTELSKLVAERWPDLESAYIALQNDSGRVRAIAALAEPVASLCDIDGVAARICADAADELAKSAVTALRRVEDREGGENTNAEAPTMVAILGGVFGSARIRTRFTERVASELQNVQIVQPRGTGLDGAALLMSLRCENPLYSLLSDTRSGA